MTTLDRRTMLTRSLTGLTGAAGVAGLTMVAPQTGHAASTRPNETAPATSRRVLRLTGKGDETAKFQTALDEIGNAGGGTVDVPTGSFQVTQLKIPPRTTLRGSSTRTVLQAMGSQSVLLCKSASNVAIESLTIDARFSARFAIEATDVANIRLTDLNIANAGDTAVQMERTSGTIANCRITDAANVGIFANDSTDLQITDNTIIQCGNNGIQVWRSTPGHDGTILTGNRIRKIQTRAGGTGQNGNGINLFRADNVQVIANHVSDCAFSAIRANASSNVQIVSNSCHRLGEVAIYAEFTFEGAILAQNIIDHAATGIAVTNFSEGGRLAVIQGNLVRNLFRREDEPVDKRGVGIAVEADATITGNTIETAATAGISIGHHQHMRDCAVTGNVIRKAPHGILVSSHPDAGACLVANNLFSGARLGAIKAKDGTTAIGPDLASRITTTDRIVITGNLAVS